MPMLLPPTVIVSSFENTKSPELHSRYTVPSAELVKARPGRWPSEYKGTTLMGNTPERSMLGSCSNEIRPRLSR